MIGPRIGILLVSGLFLISLGAPAANAAASFTISIEADDGHDATHERKVGDNRRLQIPIKVTATAQEFVCSDNAVFEISFPPVEYPSSKEWAGATTQEPEAVKFTVTRGDGFTTPKVYGTSDGDKKGMLDIFWGENRPTTNAAVTYVVNALAVGPTGVTCAPSFTPGAARIEVTVIGDDILEVGNVTKDCEVAPDLPECQKNKDKGKAPEAESPGVETGLILAAVVALALAVRRRKQ